MANGNILYSTPGQVATLVLETVGPDGYKQDPPTVPTITGLILPSLSFELGFPQNMTRVTEGIYVYKYTIPSGAVAVGSYIFDVVYFDPSTSTDKEILYQLVVNAPYGVYNVMAP